MPRLAILLVFGFLLLGCTTSPASTVPSASESASPTPSTTPDASAAASATPYASVYPSGDSATSTYDVLPRVSSSSARPSTPDRNEPFVISVTANDEVGIRSISWESTASFSSQPESKSSDCGLQKECSVSFTFKAPAEGALSISVFATDTSGQESSRSTFAITVRPFDYKAPAATPVPSASARFACANGVCEGGESYQSCPQDCSVSSAVGSTCGDGSCSPGEDVALCAADCTTINSNCGNNVCDASETSSTCSADCQAAASVTPACTSNEACGYKEICQDGVCVDVDCTNDSHCGYGKECSYNSCVRCRTGPYGPAC